MRQALIKYNGTLAGRLWESEDGYHFQYDASYLSGDDAQAVSLTIPLHSKEYKGTTLFPFFDGLIPEGWLLDIVERNWKLSARDRMGLLLSCCQDCIGAVSVHPLNVAE